MSRIALVSRKGDTLRVSMDGGPRRERALASALGLAAASLPQGCRVTRTTLTLLAGPARAGARRAALRKAAGVVVGALGVYGYAARVWHSV
jgi:hypothetical protein